MNNPSDDTPKKDPSESPVGINGARSQTVIVRNFVLAFTSGFIDALNFLGLGVFASVQTANTVLLGLSIGSENILQALVSLVAITCYIGGVAIGARIVDPTPVPQKIWPRAVTKAFAIEVLVLLLLAIGGFFASSKPSGPLLYVLIALAAVRALGVSDISTTYITGTYTSLVSSLASQRRSKTLKNTGKGTVETRLKAAVVVVYVLAAIAGGVAETSWLLKAAIIPVISIGLVIAVARICMP
ncbi:MAG: YoaK family protein [Candidatus Nitrosopolaris sp.]